MVVKIYVLGFYEIVPGFLFSAIAIVVVSLIRGEEPSQSMQSLFDVMVRRVREES
ncbi:MAG: hypothetical protein Q9M92_07935 [Enterobacterales bacterium]|nr:hypothetical protein [Enterobacterales bacterium]